MKASLLLVPGLLLSLFTVGCKDDASKAKPEPTGASSAALTPSASAGAVAKGGAVCTTPGELTDSVSAPFFPKSLGGYCLDPQGEVKTYGEKAKLTMDQVCTSAFDGECEVYKRFGLKRVVSLRYVDGEGKGSAVEVIVSEFADPGAYGMFTFRVGAGDPADPATPKPLQAGAAGAIGTGRAYVWRGSHVVELQYTNENESQDELTKSSAPILTALGKEIGQRLPGALALPPAAQALPTEKLVPNGIAFQPKDVLGFNGVGPAALGFYKDGDKRWRLLSIVKDDVEAAKDAFKTMKSKPGSLPITGVGDEAVHIAVPMGEGDKSGTKVEYLVARKGRQIWGVGDEEYALRAAEGPARDKARLTKEEATEKMKPLLAQPAPAPAASGSAAPKGSAAPATSASAAPKK